MRRRLAYGADRLFVISVVLLLLSACGPRQSDIDRAVDATRTADKLAADAVATGVAATLDALPPPTRESATRRAPTPSRICTENMGSVEFLGASYLRGDRFMVTLEKAVAFLSQEYVLLVNAAPYDCSVLDIGGPKRIYCIGQPIPRTARATVELQAADSSCSFDLPFDSIPVPPKVAPTEPGPYG